MNRQYVQLDLFSGDSEILNDSKPIKKRGVSCNEAPRTLESSGFKYADIINGLLQEGVQSAKEMTDRLVMLLHDQGTVVDFFITGKPHLYIPVCIYLDELVSNGVLNFVEGDMYDRQYSIVKSE